MSDFNLAEFVPRKRKTPFEIWEDKFPDRVEAEFGVPWDARTPPIILESEQGETSKLTAETTWAHIPGDSVDRLSEANDFLSVFFDIVSETYANLREAAYNDFVAGMRERLGDDLSYEPGDWIQWTISYHAKQPFQGVIANPQIIFSDDSDYPESQNTAPTTAKSVVIEKVVSNPSRRLARDSVEYKIDAPDQVFGSTYGHFELMVRELLNADLEPASVNYGVEFEDETRAVDTVGIFTGL